MINQLGQMYVQSDKIKIKIAGRLSEWYHRCRNAGEVVLQTSRCGKNCHQRKETMKNVR
jgi:hypothetical protein